MMKTNFTHRRLLKRLLTVFVLGIFINVSSYAQSCACKGGIIQISLDETGLAEVTASMLLADNATCAGTQTVTIMTTPTGNPIPTSPFVNCTHIGKTLYGKVSNGVNSCWTTISVEDKLKPVITCPTGVMTLSCVDMSTFTPTVVEACGPVVLDTVAETTLTCNELPAGSSTNILKRITRTYQATDASGNVSEPCVIVFDVTVADFSAIVYPTDYDVAAGNNDPLVCNGPWAKLPNGNPSPQNINVGTVLAPEILPGTGFPTLSGVSLLDNTSQLCNLMVSYSDSNPIRIGCTTKIMRTWTVIEWSCRNIPPVTRLQVLEIIDNLGPQISGLSDITASTTDHSCEGRVTFPNPILVDNCSSANQLTADITIYPDGNLASPGVFIKHGASKTVLLPVGNHIATYTAYDACYNKTTFDIAVNVADNTPPVAICDEFATVGLSTQGVAWVPASVFDDGSYDECALSKFLVRRMNPAACGCDISEFNDFHTLGEYNGHFYYLSKHKVKAGLAPKFGNALGGYLFNPQSTGEIGFVNTEAAKIIAGIEYLYSVNNEIRSLTVPATTGSVADLTLDYYYVVEINEKCGWGSYAKFCCSDVSANQMVAFRAVDASGNYNDCMVSAVIQDKIGPSITCPADETVDCDFAYDPDDLRKDFGWPIATDNCETLEINEVANIQLNSCRIGTITRTFTVTDAGGRSASCTQVITFNPTAPYSGPSSTHWPKDKTVNGCGNPADPAFLPAVLGSPILTDGACSLVGAQYVDEVYSFNQPNSPACFKILRKWTVIDWCQPLPSGGYRTWTHTQEIKVVDNVAPVVEQLNPIVTADTYDANCQSGEITLTASATDACTAVLKSSYKIDAGNDGTFDYSSSVFNSNTINASSTYPVGTHRIVYTFEDKCGNITSREQLFKIVNKKAPSAIVLQGLAISLMKVGEGEGMAEIWATDFDPDGKSSHPCGYPILLSFSEVVVNSLGQMVGTPNLVFDCDDTSAPVDVTVWVAALTPDGNVVQTAVNTFIDVQDNNNICSTNGRKLSVNGVISTETNQTLEEANVALRGSELNKLTDKNGFFDFSNMPTGGKYTVIPEKNDDHLNGVSTLDLVIIQRHILGLERLDSPYKSIAADINKDGKITAADLVELRKLILGSIDNFSSNNSWRFVDKRYQFNDLQNAQGEAFPETYHIDLLNTDMKTDFIAVKIGDVNGNAIANNFMVNTESRTTNSLSLATDNDDFTTGQKVIIPIKVAEMNAISGMQFTLEFDSELLQLTGVDPSSINVNDLNFGFTNIQNGLIAFSWNNADATVLKHNTTLFNLSFIAKDNGNIASAININSNALKAEAYDEDKKVMPIDWRVNNIVSGFVLHQNTPNPFNETTNVNFELPEAMAATITVYDVTGKVVNISNIEGLKGYNTVSFDKNDLRAGILYYTLQAGSFKATKKMVVIE